MFEYIHQCVDCIACIHCIDATSSLLLHPYSMQRSTTPSHVVTAKQTEIVLTYVGPRNHVLDLVLLPCVEGDVWMAICVKTLKKLKLVNYALVQCGCGIQYLQRSAALICSMC